nr:aminoacyl-tRNA hydrolase [Nanoarchaeum sp.]
MTEYKQVILVRTDLRMSKGKLSAQVAHASVEATLKSESAKVKSWQKKGMKKVILQVDSLDDLFKYKKLAEDKKLKTALIKDAGKTEFKEPTITCLAIGPDEEEGIDIITGKLKAL